MSYPLLNLSSTPWNTERSEGENSWGLGGAVSPPMGSRGEAPENFEILIYVDARKCHFPHAFSYIYRYSDICIRSRFGDRWWLNLSTHDSGIWLLLPSSMFQKELFISLSITLRCNNFEWIEMWLAEGFWGIWMTQGFKCVRTHFFCKLARAWRTQENLCAHKIAQARTGPLKMVFAAPEISGRSAILSRLGCCKRNKHYLLNNFLFSWMFTKNLLNCVFLSKYSTWPGHLHSKLLLVMYFLVP